MRVLFSKIHCPSFNCFCKPPSHLYKPGPLKVENTPAEVVFPTCVSVPVPIASDHLSTAEGTPIATAIEVQECGLDDEGDFNEIPKATIEAKEGDLDEIPKATIEVKEGDLDEIPKARIEAKEGDLDGNQQIEIILKSSLKKAAPLEIDTPKEVAKKKVQWMDHLGDKLHEIKEFEASEEDDSDNEGENRCVCVIL